MTTVTSAMLQVIGKGFKDMLLRFIGHPPEVPSPLPRIRMEEVRYNQDKQKLTITGLWGVYIVSVQDTNSMDGLIDFEHKLCMTKNFLIEELTVGDPIMYHHGRTIILHQIVFIGEDNKGWFALTKGVNHFFPDLWSVRGSDIISRLVAIIYG